MRRTRTRRRHPSRVITLIVVLSAAGLISGAAGLSDRPHGFIPTTAEPGSKDCSKVEDCRTRCQCEYDQCASPCGVYETECVSACIKSANTCKEACKS